MHSQDVFQLSALGTNTEVVQDRITLLVLELGSGSLLLDGLANGIKILITSR